MKRTLKIEVPVTVTCVLENEVPDDKLNYTLEKLVRRHVESRRYEIDMNRMNILSDEIES